MMGRGPVIGRILGFGAFLCFFTGAAEAAVSRSSPESYTVYYGDFASAEMGLDGWEDILLYPPKDIYLPLTGNVSTIIPLRSSLPVVMLCGSESGEFSACEYIGERPSEEYVSDDYTLIASNFSGGQNLDIFLHSQNSSLSSVYLENSDSEYALADQFVTVAGLMVSGAQVSVVQGSVVSNSELMLGQTVLEYTGGRFRVGGVEPISTWIGATAGSVSVEMGSMSYSVPINIAPGTAGMQPGLSVGYSSDRGVGMMGVGFSLSGASSITRCEKSFLFHGDSERVTLGLSDVACLDGNELLLVSGSYWGNGSKYRLRKESFSSIEFSAGEQGEVGRFLVKDKAGLISTYGGVINAVAKSGSGVEYRWSVSKVSDRIGNYYEVEYRDGTLAQVPERYIYTKNDGVSSLSDGYAEVEIKYLGEEDLSTGYEYGVSYPNGLRVERIISYVDGELYREYLFQYEENPATKNYRLASLYECADDRKCLSPTEFEWEIGDVANYTSMVSWAVPSSWVLEFDPAWYVGSTRYRRWVDVSGDGISDLCIVTGLGSSGDVVCFLSDGGGGFSSMTRVNADISGSGAFPDFIGGGGINYSSWNKDPIWYDINTDGAVDFCITGPLNGSDARCYINNGTGTDFGSAVSIDIDHGIARDRHGKSQWVDVDADGFIDHCATYFTNNGKYYIKCVYGSSGAGFIPGGGFTQEIETLSPIFAYINADSLPDICWLDDNDLYCQEAIDGSSFDSSSWVYEDVDVASLYTTDGHDYGYTFADFNSDGLDDFCRVIESSVGNRVGCVLSSGKNWARDVKSDIFSGQLPPAQAWVDINDDGGVDWCRRETNAAQGDPSLLKCMTSHNGGFEDIVEYPLQVPADHLSVGFTMSSLDPVDLNGDGNIDLCGSYFSDDGQGGSTPKSLCYSRPDAKLPDYLLSITNGQGLKYEAEYRSMYDDSVYELYQPQVSSIGAQRYMLQPRQLVYRLGASNGIGGTSWRVYKYRNYSWDPAYQAGGFEYVSERPEGGESLVESWFYQIGPYKELSGALVKRVEWAENASGTLVKISEETSDWDFVERDGTGAWSPSSGVTTFTRTAASSEVAHYAFIKSSTKESWELDGVLIGETSTVNEYDDFGGLDKQTTVLSRGDQSFTKVLDNVIDNDETTWTLGRVTESVNTVSGAYQGVAVAPISRTSSWEYYPASSPFHGMVWKEKVEPDLPVAPLTGAEDAFGKITEYKYNQFGLREEVIETTSGKQRSAEVAYDIRGRHITDEWNSLDHHTHHEYHPVLPKRTSSTDPNNLMVKWQYDPFGRATETTAVDGIVTVSDLVECDAQCPANSVYYSVTWAVSPLGTVVKASAREYYDVLGRVVERRQDAYDGKVIVVSMEYDADGNVYRHSEPYFMGEAVHWNTVSQRDVKGRPLSTIRASGLQEAMAYTALSVTATTSWVDPVSGLAQDRVRSTLTDLLGNSRLATDEAGQSVSFLTDAFGNRVETTTPDLHSVVQTFNVKGERISIDDPDAGFIRVAVSGYGEVLLQENARGFRECTVYDGLGRVISRTDNFAPGLSWDAAVLAAFDDCNGEVPTTLWVYDVPAKGVGRLAYVYHQGLLYQEVKYDGLGRPFETDKHIDGKVFTSTSEYDPDTARLVKSWYPQSFETQRFSIGYEYAQDGTLEKVTNHDGSLSYWELESMDARGNLTEVSLSAGAISIARNYSPSSGFLESLTAGGSLVSPTLDNIADMNFIFDAYGNLRVREESRDDSGQNNHIKETFDYDLRSRLTGNTVESTTHPSVSHAASVAYEVSGNGNILSKSGVGTYHYGGSCMVNGASVTAGPHAVTAITVGGQSSKSICYDEAGNVLSDGDRSVTYTTYNKPAQISNASGEVAAFSYGPGRELFKRADVTAQTSTTKYMLGTYELIEESQSGVDTSAARYYVGGSLVITVHDSAPASLSEKYLFHDHQGSLIATANPVGAIESRFAYDAWGYRRDWLNWMLMSKAALNAISVSQNTTERGYTGHEMLDPVGLIHMGGRVYDPELARFLSPDVHVQEPENYQNYNRYSYVLNRPTSLTDPTGYSWWSDNVTSKWRKIRNEIAAVISPDIALAYHSFDKGSKELARFAAKNEFAGEIIGVVGIAACSFVSAGTATAACAGAYQGAVTTAIAYGSGVSFEKALAAGAEAGALAYVNTRVSQGIGKFTSDMKGVTGRLSSGALHASRGAVFSGGDYRSGALAGFAQGFLEGDISALVGDESLLDMAQGAGLSALVGGAVAVAGGGKFGSGAVTGAFGYLMNQWQTGRSEREHHLLSEQDARDVLEYFFEGSTQGMERLSLDARVLATEMYEYAWGARFGYLEVIESAVPLGMGTSLSSEVAGEFVERDMSYSEMWFRAYHLPADTALQVLNAMEIGPGSITNSTVRNRYRTEVLELRQ